MEEQRRAWNAVRRKTWREGFLGIVAGFVTGRLGMNIYQRIAGAGVVKSNYSFAVPLVCASIGGVIGSTTAAKNEIHHVHYANYCSKINREKEN